MSRMVLYSYDEGGVTLLGLQGAMRRGEKRIQGRAVGGGPLDIAIYLLWLN